ncbi:MAG: DUF1972 domain-containing protein [Acidobacteriaceae bacterium]|nr:DUF1972 domain-containing protein [Acidobacteriaceae bacterium]
MEVQILGTRGVPAAHGGFETFAEVLALHLTKLGHRVTVYCQSDVTSSAKEDFWQGIRRIHLHGGEGPLGTMRFDLAAVRESLRSQGVPLILGYNTAIFSVLYLLKRRKTIMNMDGIEWKREKWSRVERLWLMFNEFLGARLSTHLIADHPEIARHLERHTSKAKISVIAYGADELPPIDVPTEEERIILATFGVEVGRYMIVIARPEPENSILEIVEAFCRRSRPGKLIVLGRLSPQSNAYHSRIMDMANSDVIMPGAIFDKTVVKTLRRFSMAYIHGHKVGGTNPSLVEALAAGNPVIARSTPFNAWVAGPGAEYFQSTTHLDDIISKLFADPECLANMRAASRARFQVDFKQEKILGAYTQLLEAYATD